MENWGLLIHREVNILFDEEIGNSAQRQRIALIVAHELSHMWFGGKIFACASFLIDISFILSEMQISLRVMSLERLG